MTMESNTANTKRLKAGIVGVIIAVAMIMSGVGAGLWSSTASADPGVTAAETWRRLKAGSGNDNDTNPAMIQSTIPQVNQLTDGAMSLTARGLSAKTTTRFGVYLKYQDAQNFVSIGFDSNSNWFYEYKVNGAGKWPAMGVPTPESGVDQAVDLKWEGKNLWVTINGQALNSGNPFVIDALESLKNAPLRIKASNYQNGITDFIFKDVTIKDGTGSVIVDNGADTWTVVSTGGTELFDPNYVIPDDPPAESIESEQMTVGIDNKFPRVVHYQMNDSGAILYGQTEVLDTIVINGVEVKPTVTFDKTNATTAYYDMRVVDTANAINAELRAMLEVIDNTVIFKITRIRDYLPVHTIDIPNHSLVSVRDDQTDAAFAGTQLSTNSHTNGDTYTSLASRATGAQGYMYGFVSGGGLAAGLWSNSENGLTTAGKGFQRVTAVTGQMGAHKAVGLKSTYWTYQKGEDYRKQNTWDELPTAKVAIAPDTNADGVANWEDAAIAYRDIMEEVVGSESVPDRTAWRISMNFGSQAQNPFLTTLDNVKKVYLNTDGLGQAILLKGYASEGHDSGHLDYANVGERMGGVEDLKLLLDKAAELGAQIGVHVNASETQPESKYFEEERLWKYSSGAYEYGWDWIDQAFNIVADYDLRNGREQRFQDLYDALGGEDNNLAFVYVDVWGDSQAGDEGTWATSQLAKEINNLGWSIGGEYSWAFAYQSTLSHWGLDLNYGGYTNKGINSPIARFIQNHQRDTWIGNRPEFGGAAVNPLLGGYDMVDFEGWQGRNDYQKHIQSLFANDLTTKYLQHFLVTDWQDGTPVTMSDNGQTYQWTPEMKVALEDADGLHQIVSTRGSNNVSEAGYKERTITYDGATIVKNDSYLLPWIWDADGQFLKNSERKLYHWNAPGGVTSWDVPTDWSGTAKLYELTEDGKQFVADLPITGGKVTIEAKAGTPYVLHKGESANPVITWSEGMHLSDVSFNSGALNSWTVSGDANQVQIATTEGHDRVLTMGDNTADLSVTQTLSDLTPGQQYAVYVGVDNRSDAKASLEVTSTGGTASNHTERSIAKNYIKAYAHNTNAPTVDGSSYFQNMYVFFTAPADGSDVTLTLKRAPGEGLTYFDGVRVVENESAMRPSDDRFEQDFENVAQGIYPFVVADVEGVEDNRTHLSENHEPYTKRGWNAKAIDDVIEGDWSLKAHNLTNRNRLVYRTIPQNFRFEPGETYTVSFDYEAGTAGAYAFMTGNTDSYAGLPTSPLPTTIDKTGAQRATFSVIGADDGQTWIGIYSANTATNNQGSSGSAALFRGYSDLIMDNLVIERSTVSKDALQESIEEANGLDEAVYSPESWDAMTSARQAAEAVRDDPAATQEEVNQAKADLDAAMDALVVVAGVVWGSVTDADGNPVAGVTVQVSGTDAKTVTAADGSYRIEGVTMGEHTLVTDSRYYENTSASLTVTTQTPKIEQKLTIERGDASLSGDVTAVGQALPNAVVELVGSTGTYTTTSDADGKYAFADLPADKYEVTVTPAQPGYETLELTLDLGKSETLVKELMVEPGLGYDYFNDFDDGTTTWVNLPGDSGDATLTPEDGATTVSFPGGINANHPTRVCDSAAPTFTDGAVEMDLTPSADAVRVGILLRADDAGNRVYVGTEETSSKWFVEYWGAQGNSWSSMTQGPSLAAGETSHVKAEIVGNTVRLWVDGALILEQTMPKMHSGEGCVGLSSTKANEVSVDNVKVTVYDPAPADTRTVVGLVTDGTAPAVGIEVTIKQVGAPGEPEPDPGVEITTTTDMNGNYKFEAIPDGTYTVTAVTADNRQAVRTVTVEARDGYIIVPPIRFGVDKEALEDAIDEANALVAEDYTPDSWAVVETALKAAEQVFADDTVTQGQIDQAKAALEAALEGLAPVPVDKSGLASAIDAATEALADLIVSVDGSQVSPDVDWVTQGEKDAAQKALDEAKVILDKPGATEAEVADALDAIREALEVLDAAGQPGKSDLAGTIADAGKSLDGLKASVDGTDVPKDQYWVTQAAKDAVQAVLDEADGLLHDPTATEAEVAAALKAIEDALAGLDPKPGTQVDKADVGKALAGLEAAVEGLEDSDLDGLDVARDLYWVDPDERAELEKAIEDAKVALAADPVDQEALESALEGLEDALAGLPGMKEPGKLADKAALESAVERADQALKDLTVSVDGSEVSPEVDWVTQAEKDAAQKALDEAKVILDKPGATEAEVAAALDAIREALDVLDGAGQPGKSDLAGTIADAGKSLDGLKTSVDGSDVPKDQQWYAQSDVDAVKVVLDEADAVLHDPDATEAQVADAIKAIEDALAGLKSKPGTQVDQSDLDSAIKGLEDALKDLPVSDLDGRDVAKDLYWLDPTEKAELVKAVEDAKSVLNDPKATPEEIAQAIKDTEKALDDLEGMKEPGKLVDKAGLESALEQADQVLKDLTVSVDGSQVSPEVDWVTQGEKDAAQKALDEAKVILDKPGATEAEVADALDAIREALEVLDAAGQPGKSDLAGTIADAGKSLDGLKTSVDGSDVPKDQQWYAQSDVDAVKVVLDEADAVLHDPDATEAQVADAIKAIEDALAGLKSKPGTQVDPTPGPDKSGLESAVKGLEDALKDLPVSDKAGADVPSDESWIDPTEKAELVKVVEDAKSVLNDPNATTEEVAQAIKDIAQALEDLEGMKEPGTQFITPPQPDKSGLSDALKGLEDAVKGLTVSDKAGADVPSSQSWIDPAEKAELDKVIEDAKSALNDPTATAEEVAQAIKDIAQA
ncbi:MAG: endo-alpha-N-acetylgalactosaminidase family protein, partial [Propionibacteriaceae bacterium]|nr:endo-alpha-N-acetylgalactosaminidase family protein [Propionibacteriaceae bacterium]